MSPPSCQPRAPLLGGRRFQRGAQRVAPGRPSRGRSRIKHTHTHAQARPLACSQTTRASSERSSLAPMTGGGGGAANAAAWPRPARLRQTLAGLEGEAKCAQSSRARKHARARRFGATPARQADRQAKVALYGHDGALFVPVRLSARASTSPAPERGACVCPCAARPQWRWFVHRTREGRVRRRRNMTARRSRLLGPLALGAPPGRPSNSSAVCTWRAQEVRECRARARTHKQAGRHAHSLHARRRSLSACPHVEGAAAGLFAGNPQPAATRPSASSPEH